MPREEMGSGLELAFFPCYAPRVVALYLQLSRV
jgi:hypothetical protein